jgi:hypothetical protein
MSEVPTNAAALLVSLGRGTIASRVMIAEFDAVVGVVAKSERRKSYRQDALGRIPESALNAQRTALHPKAEHTIGIGIRLPEMEFCEERDSPIKGVNGVMPVRSFFLGMHNH